MRYFKMVNSTVNWLSSLLRDDFANRISDPENVALGRAEQFALIQANIGTVAIGNMFAGFLTVMTFVGSDQFSKAIGWFLGFLVIVSFTMGRGAKSTSRDKHRRKTNSDKHQVVTVIILGSVWVLMPVLLFGGAGIEQRLFIIATMLALIGVGAYFLSGVPRAAVLFSLIMMSGLLFVIVYHWHSSMLNSSFLILVFSLLVIGMIKRNAIFLADRMEARMELVKSNDMIGVLLREHEDSGYEWLWETDENGKIKNVSKKFVLAAGVDEEQLHGTEFLSLLNDLPHSHSNKNDKINCRVGDAFAAKEAFRDIVVGYKHPNGETRWWKLSGRPIIYQKNKQRREIFSYRGVAIDITDEKNSEDKIAYLALYDSLTNLPNRASFKERLDASIAEIENSGTGIALFLLDLDKFKHINDTLGHPAGDELLVMVAKRLVGQCENAAIVSRLGGDEFAIVVNDMPTAQEAEKYAEILIGCFKEQFFIAGRKMSANCSIGVALSPVHGTNSGDLIKNADLALYRAKTESKCSSKIFNAGMDLQVRERRRLGQELQSAITNDELYLLYQPLLCTATNSISGYEALVRWNNPRCGMVNPKHFIQIAEELGMIADIGKWVIRQACNEAASWNNSRRISVNLSPLQFVGIQLELVVARALGDSGLNPSRLELEITENSLMVNKDATLHTLKNLRELGVSIALDDFGTGYSSLSYLMSYPIDKIKIDRCFLSGGENMGNNVALIQTIIGLAKILGMKTTVEGVETIEHLEFLKREGCDEIQGYLISQPLPASAINLNEDAEQIMNLAGLKSVS